MEVSRRHDVNVAFLLHIDRFAFAMLERQAADRVLDRMFHTEVCFKQHNMKLKAGESDAHSSMYGGQQIIII